MKKLLTKSKFLNGLDADALLWRVVNEPESIPKPQDFQQQIFESGTEVGIFAQQYFKNGIDLKDLDFKENIEATKNALAKRQPIFEAGFLADRYFVRVDILEPAKNNKWNIIEVKSSTKAKKTHIHDLAFQKFVLQLCGLEINDTKVMLIDNSYVRGDELDIKGLFKLENLNEKVDKFLVKVPALAEKMLRIMDLAVCPEFTIDDYKAGEYPNVFDDEFKAKLPKGSIFELYRAKAKQLKPIWKNKIELLKDYPINDKTTPQQIIQIKVAQTQETHIDKEKINEFLNGLEYPIYHLDFETFAPAIPEFKNTQPYRQIPFQYSLHIEHENGTIEHREYLHTENTDPRKPLFEQLRKEIGATGTILAFFDTFEKGRIGESVEILPEYANWTKQIIDRTQDLLTPFRQFYYYNAGQQGSCSIKKVLPVLSDLSYKNMPIANGGEAMSAYNQYIVKNEPHANKEQLIKDMLAYCKQDTWAMVLILRKLRSLVE